MLEFRICLEYEHITFVGIIMKKLKSLQNENTETLISSKCLKFNFVLDRRIIT